MQEWYLGWEKVSCLERCPQFRGALIEVISTLRYKPTFFFCRTINPEVTQYTHVSWFHYIHHITNT